jgi:hypothetical protein
VQNKLVQTFQVLTEFASFDGAAENGAAASARARDGAKQQDSSSTGRAEVPAASSLGLNVNIQLQLPATADGEVYEKFFGAMRKHLMGLAEPG